MVALLILKHIRNISDESVVELCSDNIYCQYFCGKTSFVYGQPCETLELSHFRKSIGEKDVELILQESIRVNGKDKDNDHVSVGTTVQEKNITFPTARKMQNKIIKKYEEIVEMHNCMCGKLMFGY